nr:right-handed parallel beta-helix repeat-containing protein [Candidatus Cloacimonadota bacterium]
MKKIILLIILLAVSIHLFSQTNNPYIPMYRQGNWRLAGLEFDNIIEVNELINVKDFIYSGIHYSAAGNGEDDDTSIIQNAIDKANNNSGFNIVYFPAGIYKITNSLNLPSEISLKGSGSGVSTLYFNIQDDNNCITIQNKIKTGIEDLKIQRCGIGEDSGKTIVISSSDNCWVKGVESTQASGHHILITNNSTHIDIHGCYIHHAKDYVGGGHGYGVWITHNSSLCLIENNIIRHLRHSMIVADGAFGNVFGYNYSDDIQDSGFWDLGDICLHGHCGTDIGPFKNLFEGNNCWYIDVDDQWGVNGDYNTFLRNRSIEKGIKVVEGNDNCNIINNYFRNCTHYSSPWIVYGDNHIAENNRVNYNGTIVWRLNQNPGYWQIESFYSDYNYDPIEEINYANERYHNSTIKTVYSGYSHYSLPSIAIGTINLSGGSGNLDEGRVIFRKMEFINNEFILTDKFYNTTNEVGEYEVNIQSGFEYKVSFEHLSGNYENETIQCYISPGTTNISTVTLLYNPDKYIIVPNDYDNIQEGLDHIQDGGTVVVMNGTYQGYDNHNLTWSDKHITLRAQSLNNPEDCIIDGNSSGDHAFYLTDSQINNNDQIFGFTIRNFDGVYYNGAVCFKNLASPLISNCIIEDCSLNNPDDLDHYGLGIAIYCEGNTVVENCIIRNNEGWDTEGGAAIACKGNVTIRNNEIYGNSLCTYLSVGSVDVDRQGVAVYILADENNAPTIYNNEIYNNTHQTTGPGQASLIYSEYDISWNYNDDPI